MKAVAVDTLGTSGLLRCFVAVATVGIRSHRCVAGTLEPAAITADADCWDNEHANIDALKGTLIMVSGSRQAEVLPRRRSAKALKSNDREKAGTAEDGRDKAIHKKRKTIMEPPFG